MSRITRSVRISAAVAFLVTHVFIAGFWLGSVWTEHHLGGTIVRNKTDALIYLLCTPQDTPQECASKLAIERMKQRDSEDSWKIAEPQFQD